MSRTIGGMGSSGQDRGLRSRTGARACGPGRTALRGADRRGARAMPAGDSVLAERSGDEAKASDEVIVGAGAYTLARTDLRRRARRTCTIHGDFGGPMPTDLRQRHSGYAIRPDGQRVGVWPTSMSEQHARRLRRLLHRGGSASNGCGRRHRPGRQYGRYPAGAGLHRARQRRPRRRDELDRHRGDELHRHAQRGRAQRDRDRDRHELAGVRRRLPGLHLRLGAPST